MGQSVNFEGNEGIIMTNFIWPNRGLLTPFSSKKSRQQGSALLG